MLFNIANDRVLGKKFKSKVSIVSSFKSNSRGFRISSESLAMLRYYLRITTGRNYQSSELPTIGITTHKCW